MAKLLFVDAAMTSTRSSSISSDISIISGEDSSISRNITSCSRGINISIISSVSSRMFNCSYTRDGSNSRSCISLL